MAADPELVQRARTLRAAGLSIEQIATRLDLRSRTMVYRWVRDLPTPQWTARPNAKDDLREQARMMRVDGATYDEIVRRLGVSKSRCPSGCETCRTQNAASKGSSGGEQGSSGMSRSDPRGPPVSDSRQLRPRRRRSGELTERELVISGVVAYWAEGTKRKPWNPQERVAFINSDVDMIKLFLAFLALMRVERERIQLDSRSTSRGRHSRHCGSGPPLSAGPRSEFQPVTLKRHVPRSTNAEERAATTYHGCLVVTVRQSSEAYREVEGMWTAVAAGAS